MRIPREITNNEDIIDSRDVIRRIDWLDPSDIDEEVELNMLIDLSRRAEDAPDWLYGAMLVRDSYFIEYTKGLVDECYNINYEDSWPHRHLEMDWSGAASELQNDYMDVDFGGVTYWVRA